MPKGYALKPDVQMKVEDERAGRLDYTYETRLSADECLARIGNKTDGRLSEYETLTKDGCCISSSKIRWVRPADCTLINLQNML